MQEYENKERRFTNAAIRPEMALVTPSLKPVPNCEIGAGSSSDAQERRSALDAPPDAGSMLIRSLPARLFQAPGEYASTANNQIDARCDADVIRCYLSEVSDSRHTIRARSRELRRLAAWADAVCQKTISDLNRNDFRNFLAYLQSPVEPGDTYRREPLQTATLKNTFSAIKSFLDYAVGVEYMTANTIASIKIHDTKSDHSQVENYLTLDLFQHLLAVLQTRENGSPRDRKLAHRMRFLLTISYGLALRAEEIVNARWHDFFMVTRNGKAQWWLRTIGKGNKKAEIPVADLVMQEVHRYRSYLQRNQPIEQDDGAISLSMNGTKAMGYKGLYQTLKDFFVECADELERKGDDRHRVLRMTSPHWMRHTSITHLLESGQTLRDVSRFARHSKITTTQRYDHSDRDRLHSTLNVAPIGLQK